MFDLTHMEPQLDPKTGQKLEMGTHLTMAESMWTTQSHAHVEGAYNLQSKNIGAFFLIKVEFEGLSFKYYVNKQNPILVVTS